ncbi:glycosyltransferase [bacterium]|nr:glycosyltransferase [bacterium]
MIKNDTIEIQKEFLKKGGKLKKYQELILGEKGFFKLFKYELIMLCASWVPGALGLFLRSKLYPVLLGKVGRNVSFGLGVVLRHPQKIVIGDNVVIDDQCVLDAKGSDNRGIFIGNGVFLGRGSILNCKNGDIILKDNVNISSNCLIFSASEVKIEADVLLAAYCYLVGGTHHFDDPEVPVLYQKRSSKGIQVGSGGWLGAHVSVFDGVAIGKSVVIGAGSVVNKNIPDYAIAAGVPIKVIKKRRTGMIESLSPKENPEKKRLLYISVYDPHVPFTGAGVRGAEFINYLARYYYMDLIYMTGSGHPGDSNLEKKFANRIQGIDNKIRIPFTQLGYFFFSKDLFRAASNLLKEKKYDFIFADYGLGARYGYTLSKKFGIPFIYSSHNIEYRQYLGKAKSDFRRLPLIPYVHWVEKKGCKNSYMLVAISENDAQFYSKWVPHDKIVLVPQGFDETVYHPFYEPYQNDPKIVLFFGNYNIITNRDAVKVIHEHIVDEVIRRMPNTKFQFVGANPPLHLAHPNFEFTGFVESILPYIRKADLVISPILKGWGMPTKVIESLACGKRIISTEAGARGISKHYSRLTVCNIQHFPKMICEALQHDSQVDTCDFEMIKDEYGWGKRLSALKERIDTY